MKYESLPVNQISHHNQNSTAKVLKEGSQVLVRIIKNLGNNKYAGSVAGARVTIHSKNLYKNGDVFKANITFKNGIPKLIPQKTEISKNPITIEKLPSLESNNQITGNVQNQALAQFITSMGMVPDNLSNVILLQMKNLGLKFNSILMNKIHDIAAKYPGKEKIAVELMMSFLQKGIEFDPKVLDDLIEQIDNDVNLNQSEPDPIAIESSFISINQIKNFFKELMEYDNEQDINIISVANTLGSKKDINGFGSWFIFPFEITEKNIQVSTGFFRLLLSNEKKLSKFCIEHSQAEKKQLFVLNFSGSKCKSILVNQTVDNQEFEKELLLQKLRTKIKESNLEIEVKWDSRDRLEGNTFGMQDFFLIDGEV